ncbi:flavodoxin-dependent (E)-4-hydroxy-3-methylbut-2-enyl-diphosphate synthase, partial [archaeon]|nr:flavodoxin-dependent (E)-4-hydroxy-3-methylbut-2-enyl-diphosphate synthase [archaeon]
SVGNVIIGGDAPVRVQSMTNTLTADVNSTVKQIIELANAGSELVRFTVKDEDDAKAVPIIKKCLEEKNCSVPIVGDFHYNGHLLLSKYPECAKALDKYRINPGNVGFGNAHDDNFKQMVDIAIKYGKPVRIGVNAGSLDQSVLKKLMDENKDQKSEELLVEAMVISSLESAKKAESYGLNKNKIVLSAKVSKVPEMISAYQKLAKRSDYALHLGLTEAGLGTKGVVASSAALSVLLQQGIGDTIRVSITPKPGSSRTEEVFVSQQILQVNNIRKFMPMVTSCPGCGRTTSTLFQKIAEEITDYLQQKTPEWKAKGYESVSNMVIAVMGCIVNGPGESKEVNIGLSLPGNGEYLVSPVFIDGKLATKLKGENRIKEFKALIDKYVEDNYS